MQDNMDERTVLYDSSQMDYMNHGKKSTLVIVDNSGIRELDLSAYSEAAYSFGRSNDNSIVIDSEIVSGHHGEICINQGVFYIKDNNSSNGTYVAYGQQFFKIQPGQ